MNELDQAKHEILALKAAKINQNKTSPSKAGAPPPQQQYAPSSIKRNPPVLFKTSAPDPVIIDYDLLEIQSQITQDDAHI